MHGMLRRIDRILLRVEHLDSAVRYYRDVLGLALVRQSDRAAALQFPRQETELILHTDPDLPAGAVYYLVDDVRDLYRRRAELRLQFVRPPAVGARGYTAAIKDPFGNVLMLIDRSVRAEEGVAPIEDGRPPEALFAGAAAGQVPIRREMLIDLYRQIGRTADDLPYTPEFERLYLAYAAAFGRTRPDRAEVWRHLLTLRKAGMLPRLGQSRWPAPSVSPEEREQLLRMLGDDLGRRDRLPYTDRFEKIVDEFNRTRLRPLSPHKVWRLVASLAK